MANQIIDGVGFPSVGSILGISNAAVARALHAKVVVLVPGHKGSLGMAVDSFNLAHSYFTAHGVDVVGMAISKVPKDKAHSLRDYATRYFAMHQHLYRTQFLGLMQRSEALDAIMASDPVSNADNACQRVTAAALEMEPVDEERCAIVEELFQQGIDLQRLLEACRE
jgi:hypothetical protein